MNAKVDLLERLALPGRKVLPEHREQQAPETAAVALDRLVRPALPASVPRELQALAAAVLARLVLPVFRARRARRVQVPQALQVFRGQPEALALRELLALERPVLRGLRV